VPTAVINETINVFLKSAISILVISNHNSFRVLFIFHVKNIYIYNLALEMASPGNQQCANYAGLEISHTWRVARGREREVVSRGTSAERVVDCRRPCRAASDAHPPAESFLRRTARCTAAPAALPTTAQ